ncbi:beta strand repeat-containing protein [Pseudobdellovibrio sp. HCB154]|uniref:beta strand repeat-containing protein n=1 Tax=Pseudobdellovibrio sp. HCB154 TaxID=3386277 RepID=UPI003916DD50
MNVCRKITHFFKYFTAIALSLLLSQTAFTQSSENQQIVVEGSLTDSGGNAIDLSGAALVFYVITDQNCYLYGESSSSAGDGQGNIAHRLGSALEVVGSPNHFTQSLFFGAASGKNISTDSPCTVAAADTRMVQVYYQAQDIRANIQLGTVPYAHNATMLNGKNAADFLQVTTDSNTLFYSGSTGQILSKNAAGNLTWTTPTSLGTLATKNSVDLNTAEVTGTLPTTKLPSMTGDITNVTGSGDVTVIRLRNVAVTAVTPSSGQVLAYNGSAWTPTSVPAGVGTVTNVAAGTGLTGGSITSSGTLSVNFGTSSGTVAAGDDARISGALQAVNNLAELSSLSSARTNLGLGSLATKSTVMLSSDVSGVLPVANGGTQWSSNAVGVMTTLNATVGSSTIISNFGLTVDAPNTANSLAAYFVNDASDGNGVKINVDNSSSSKYGLKISSSANAANLIVLNSGNVGVGTATPVTTLDVAGGVRIGMQSDICTTTFAGALRYNSGVVEYCNGSVWSAVQTGSEPWLNSGSNLYYSSGNVGIGTASPNSPLHVYGSSTEISRFDSGSMGAYVTFSRNNSPKGYIGYSSGSGILFNNEIAEAISIRSNTAVQLGTGGQAHLTVTSTGQVGIGTTAPPTSATLTVSGPIRTTAAVEFGDGTAQNSAAWGGYQHVNTNCSSLTDCMATCPAGKKIISGGCYNSASGTLAQLISSFPASDTQWQCRWNATGALTSTAFAICVKF